MLKECAVCGEIYDERGRGKYCSDACRKAGRAAYLRAYNKSYRMKPIRKRWQKENKERMDAWYKQYRAENKEALAEYNRKWKEARPGWSSEYNRKWKAANPDKVRENNKRYYLNLKLKLAESGISTRMLKAWSIQVRDRDNYTCQACESTEDVHAHHIQPKSMFPELALDLDNGMTLCNSCHTDIHSLEPISIERF